MWPVVRSAWVVIVSLLLLINATPWYLFALQQDLEDDLEPEARALYEIALGAYANTRSRVRTAHGQDIADVSTPDILSCEDFRTFWIKWE